MVRKFMPVLMLAAALMATWSPAVAEAAGRNRTAPDLFYNYYVPPGVPGDVGAELYLAPRPTPPLVGHTYVTYQPLMPHEFLYRHHQRYHRYYNEGRGLTRTSVIWW